MSRPLCLLFWAFAVAYGWGPLVAAPIAAALEAAGIGSADPELVRAIERWRLIDRVGGALVANAALALVAVASWRLSRGVGALAGGLLRMAAAGFALAVLQQGAEVLWMSRQAPTLELLLDPPAWVRSARLAAWASRQAAILALMWGVMEGRTAARVRASWVVAAAVLMLGEALAIALAPGAGQGPGSPALLAASRLAGVAIPWMALIAIVSAERAPARGLDVRPGSARLLAGVYSARAALVAAAWLAALTPGAAGRIDSGAFAVLDAALLLLGAIALARAGGPDALRYRGLAGWTVGLAVAQGIGFAILTSAPPPATAALLAVVVGAVVARASLGAAVGARVARQLHAEGEWDLARDVGRVALMAVTLALVAATVLVVVAAGAPLLVVSVLAQPLGTLGLWLLATVAWVAWRVAAAAGPRPAA